MNISKRQFTQVASIVGLLLIMLQAQSEPVPTNTITLNFRDDPGLLPGGAGFSGGSNTINSDSLQIGGYVFASSQWEYWQQTVSGMKLNGIRIHPVSAANATMDIYRQDGARFNLNSLTVNLGGQMLSDSNFDVLSCTDRQCTIPKTLSVAGLSGYSNILPGNPNAVTNTYKITLDFAHPYTLQNITLTVVLLP